MTAKLAPREWGAPVVATTADRTRLFPTAVAGQRVVNLETRAVERYDGSAWQADSALETRGTTGALATNGTLVITVPTRCVVELTLTSTNNAGLYRRYTLAGDGSGVIAATSISDTTSNTLQVSATGVTTVTIKNSTGFTATIAYGLRPLTTPLP